ncbi:mavicyanin-like [Solanum tuberosum]|uniref:NtEPc n=1 Tax=Solanum tuberosum TaxID=4113 RepID=M0ZRG5_SOLTU|nr:PREDICTED: mavicyanin-like [Solanum tuberosum]
MGSTFFYTTLCFIALTIVASSAEEFKVGDAVGWRQPSQNETDLYNHWASNKKFHIGDSLRFEYRNDSVIKVGKWEFYHCNRTHLASAGKDGTRTVNLNRAGTFYFVSGDPEHCKNGQRLAVEVLPLHPISESPPQPFSQAPAPSPLSISASVSSAVPLAFISALLISVIVVAVAGLA